MRKIFTTVFLATTMFAFSQTQITNAGFESWGGSGTSAEPTSWNSNKTGTGLASSGPQTCFQEATNPHSGASCVRVQTTYYIIAVVNGNVTTGVVNASNTDKLKGYLSAENADKIAFTGRPDSLAGWYRYTQATSGTGAAAEQAKVRAILHSGDYYDPETPYQTNHIDLSANKIGDALFVSPAANQTTWKRFSVPFNYTSTATPAFIMVNITSSNNQSTVAPSSGVGSILWVDDLLAIYNPVANFSSAAVICPNAATTFTDQSTATPTSWAWSFPGANPVSSTSQNPSITYNTAGTYSVTLISTYANNYTTTVTKTITVNAAPVITVNSPTICATQSATLTASGASTYVWNTSATTNSIIVTPSANTNYTVTGTDAVGCTNQKVTSVSISASNLNVNAATICAGGTVALVVSGANTYTWTSPASNSATVNVSPTVNTTYTVMGTNSIGCVHTATTSVSITTSVNISVNSATVCSGNTATLTATGVSSYTWTSPVSNSAIITVTPSSTTVYSVSGNAAGCPGVASATTMVTVNPTPTVSLAAITSTPCAGTNTIALTGTPAGGIYSGTGVTGASFNPSTAGTFTVVYSYTATNNCSSSDSKSIMVNACVGIEEFNMADVKLYPNPAHDILYINLNNTNSGTKYVEVYDVVGKKVLSINTTETLVSLSTGELTNGVYIVKIQVENAKPVIARFIKN